MPPQVPSRRENSYGQIADPGTAKPQPKAQGIKSSNSIKIVDKNQE